MSSAPLRRVFLSAVLPGALALGLLAGPALAQNRVPPAPQQSIDRLPHDEALKALGSALGDSVRATQADPTIPDVLKALDTNIAAAKRVRGLVEASKGPV